MISLTTTKSMGSCFCVAAGKDDPNQRLMSDSVGIHKYDDLSMIPTNGDEWKLYIQSVLEDNGSMCHNMDKYNDEYNDIDIDIQNDEFKYQSAISA